MEKFCENAIWLFFGTSPNLQVLLCSLDLVPDCDDDMDP